MCLEFSVVLLGSGSIDFLVGLVGRILGLASGAGSLAASVPKAGALGSLKTLLAGAVSGSGSLGAVSTSDSLEITSVKSGDLGTEVQAVVFFRSI